MTAKLNGKRNTKKQVSKSTDVERPKVDFVPLLAIRFFVFFLPLCVEHDFENDNDLFKRSVETSHFDKVKKL